MEHGLWVRHTFGDMDIFATMATAGGLFVGTNIDDMVVLAVLNVSSRAGSRPRVWQIWVGQYVGTAVLVIVSLLAALGLALLLPERFTWVLGLVPLSLGLAKLIAAAGSPRSGAQTTPAVAKSLTGVVALTVANGGDNIAAYTPVFRTLGAIETAITIGAFAVGVAIWCTLGAWLVSHRKITEIIQRWGHWIVPSVFILIGLYIFRKGGVFGS